MSIKKIALCTLGLGVGLWYPVSLYASQNDSVPEATSTCERVQSGADALGRQSQETLTATAGSPDDRILAARRLGEQNSFKYEQMLRLVINTPDCFSPELVAQAETRLRQFTR